jgi:hypothetical protein
VPYLSFIKITILSSAESGNIIQLKTDIFSRKVLAGCVWMMYHKQSMMKMARLKTKALLLMNADRCKGIAEASGFADVLSCK